MLLGNLLHLSFNMWEEHDSPTTRFRKARTSLWFDEVLWHELTRRMADAGYNLLVLDLGDAVRYQCHPEIAVENAWSPTKLREESQRLADMGIELVPKLNFSACHDTWLGPYSRCVSTPTYYAVCRELIQEVAALLQPRLFHLGLDEETAQHQREYNYIVVRQNELLWHDVTFFLSTVEKAGARPWIWSDLVWNHDEDFLKRMPRSVLQSNWYYEMKFTESHMAQAYKVLDAHGYEQVPTCSNWSDDQNPRRTVEFCREHLDPARLKGFLITPWRPTVPDYRDKHLDAIDLLARAVR